MCSIGSRILGFDCIAGLEAMIRGSTLTVLIGLIIIIVYTWGWRGFIIIFLEVKETLGLMMIFRVLGGDVGSLNFRTCWGNYYARHEMFFYEP